MFTNKATSLMFIALVGLLQLVASTAFAARYMVLFKNRESYIQVHSQLQVAQDANLNSVHLVSNGNVIRPFADVDASVDDSLENLGTFVVNIEDEASAVRLNENNMIALVEKEFFHPAPRPVEGFTLTPAWDYQLERASGTGARTPWGVNAVSAPAAWSRAKYGAGARVAVLDTGIDKNHPALAPNFEAGKDFVMDKNAPYDFADKNGHGSHCAGTIGAAQLSDGFVGVAPKVKILAGRVCGENGCSNVAVAQGINWAISKKVDIISMSLGGPVASPAEKRAVEVADKAGITVIAASGNDGTPSVSYPAAFPSVIAVGAVDKTISKAKFSQWGPELAVVAPGVDVVSSVPQGSGRESVVKVGIAGKLKEVLSNSFQGSPEVPHALTNALVYVGLGKPEDFKNANVAGKFAFIRRGEIKFAEKVQNAIAANAAGVVIFNNEPGLLQGSITDDGSIVAVPVVMIEQTTGEEALKQINAGQVVQASLQTSQSDYASFSGTSMATPHVAGVAALIKAANKNLKPAQVKAILKATAKPLQPNDQNQLGSGLVNAELAVAEALKK